MYVVGTADSVLIREVRIQSVLNRQVPLSWSFKMVLRQPAELTDHCLSHYRDT